MALQNTPLDQAAQERINEIAKQDPEFAAELQAMLAQSQDEEVIPYQFSSEPLTAQENQGMLAQIAQAAKKAGAQI